MTNNSENNVEPVLREKIQAQPFKSAFFFFLPTSGILCSKVKLARADVCFSLTGNSLDSS